MDEVTLTCPECGYEYKVRPAVQKKIAELEQENERLRDALEYAMGCMDNYQQHCMRTELWPELFKER